MGGLAVNQGLSHTRLTECWGHVSQQKRQVCGVRFPAWTITMDRDDAVLNSKDVAKILDMSPDTVNEYARKSILPAFKRGRQWRFRRRDIAAFIRQLHGDTAA